MQSTAPHSPSFGPQGAFLTAALVSFCVLTSACTTMQDTSLPKAGETLALHVGDDVQVQTKAGQTYSFKISAIEKDALVGAAVRVRFVDIASLQVRRLSKGKMALVTGGTIAAIASIALVVAIVILLKHPPVGAGS